MLKRIFIASLFLLTSCGAPVSDQGSESSSPAAKDAPVLDTTITQTTMRTTPEKGDHIATIKTSMGEIKVLLYSQETPETVKNFEELAKANKYDKTIFHRVIKDFMIQGGDIDNMGGYGGYSYKGPGTTFQDEFVNGLENVRGALAMANPGMPDSNGSQFFIVQAATGAPWLNGQHTVFGYVYEGMDIVDKIANVKTRPGDKPVDDIVLKDVELGTY